METPLAIVIAVDGLRASALGTYGNTTYSTPALDRLAASAEVVDWFVATSPLLEKFYREIWSGASDGSATASPALPWPAQLADQQLAVWCLSDDALVTSQAQKAGFSRAEFVSTKLTTEPAIDIPETSLAKFFSSTILQLAEWRKEAAQKGGILWLHTRGLTGSWDSPLKLRLSLLEEEDHKPAFYCHPPKAVPIEDFEEMFAWQISYAAQAVVLDKCLESFLASIAEISPLEQTSLFLLGTRGFSLGEHRRVGYSCDSLYSEQLQLPCIFSLNLQKAPLPRIPGIRHPIDIGSAIHHWLSDRHWKLGGHSYSIATSDSQMSLRTPEWLLITDNNNSYDHLFAKPDDRWELNDVASRCPEVVEQLKSLLNKEI